MRRIEIFRAGAHTDIHGNTHTLSEADLAASAEAYDPALHEAPLVVGHPKLDAPAFGWVKSLQAASDRLAAIPSQVQAAFAEQVAGGAYKKVSASFYPPAAACNPVPGVWYLRHVGFLGAMPPAIKGLRPVEFGEGDEDVVVIEFGEMDLASAPSAHTQEETVSNEELAALREQNAALRKKLDELIADRTKDAAMRQHAEHVAYAESLVEQARIPASSVPLVAMLRGVVHPLDGAPVEFGEGNARQPLDTALCAFLESLPARVEFGEQATRERAVGDDKEDADAEAVEYDKNADPDRVALDKKIRAHMKAHTVDYLTAARAVIK